MKRDFAKNKAIEAPRAFRLFALCLYAERPENPKSEREWFASVFRNLSRSDKVELRRFLADLLNRGSTEADLQKLWSSVQNNYYITGKDAMRRFLTIVWEQLDYELSSARDKRRSAHDKTPR